MSNRRVVHSVQVHSQQVAERLQRLNIKRQEIIRPAFEHPRSFVLASVREMAKQLKTDPATIVRIVNGLGFAGFREFQHYLQELSLAFATSADTMQRTAKTNGIPGHVLESLDLDGKNLQALKNTLNTERLALTAARFHKARRIIIIGGDLASVLAEYLEYHLTLLGLPAFAATSSGKTVHLTRSITNHDVVVAISFRRGLRQTVEGIQTARRRSAYCIAITDTQLSPLTEFCQETFIARIDSNSLGASYAAPIALLNALVGAIGEHRRAATLRIAEEISEEQRRGARWYQD